MSYQDGYRGVDISALPPPQIIEEPTFDELFEMVRAELVARDPEYTALVDSDPGIKVLQAATYVLGTLSRQRMNRYARAVMVAYAEETDLDALAAIFGVTRLVVDPGDPGGVPPVPPTLEDDEQLRRRVVAAPEGYSVAGPRDAYIFHARSADGRVADVTAVNPDPGEVLVTVLAVDPSDTTAVAEVVSAVDAALNDEEIRPLTDHVTVQAAVIVPYDIEVTVFALPGPEASATSDAALESLTAYATELRRLGRDVRRSAIYAAGHVAGVQRVEITSPVADIVLGPSEAAVVGSITVNYGGVDE